MRNPTLLYVVVTFYQLNHSFSQGIERVNEEVVKFMGVEQKGQNEDLL